MISKELLSEVLSTVSRIDYIDNSYGPEVIAWRGLSNEGNICTGSIGIYELAHKCKEWASSNGYIVISYIEDDNTGYASLGDLFGRTGVRLPQPKESFWFDARTEPESIFKACEWILQQKETK